MQKKLPMKIKGSCQIEQIICTMGTYNFCVRNILCRKTENKVVTLVDDMPLENVAFVMLIASFIHVSQSHTIQEKQISIAMALVVGHQIFISQVVMHFVVFHQYYPLQHYYTLVVRRAILIVHLSLDSTQLMVQYLWRSYMAFA